MRLDLTSDFSHTGTASVRRRRLLPPRPPPLTGWLRMAVMKPDIHGV
jgi:hypothetical protein